MRAPAPCTPRVRNGGARVFRARRDKRLHDDPAEKYHGVSATGNRKPSTGCVTEGAFSVYSGPSAGGELGWARMVQRARRRAKRAGDRCPPARAASSRVESRAGPRPFRGPRSWQSKEGRKWSGKRDSNPRPSAWEADALPTELFPLDRPRPSARGPSPGAPSIAPHRAGEKSPGGGARASARESQVTIRGGAASGPRNPGVGPHDAAAPADSSSIRRSASMSRYIASCSMVTSGQSTLCSMAKRPRCQRATA